MNNIIKIYSIIAYISCFAYSYHIKSISGFIFFLFASITLFLTRYYENEAFPKYVCKLIVLLYLISFPAGCYFLFQALINTTIAMKEAPTGFIVVMLISFVILGHIFVNLLNLYLNGSDALIEHTKSRLKSEEVIEREQNEKHLDDFVNKYKK